MTTDLMNNFMDSTENKNGSNRAAFYKKPIKKQNYRFDIDEETPQEVRRQLLLQQQKKRRENAFNVGRGILQEVLNFGTEDEEEMEIECNPKHKWYYYKQHKHYANHLMMSEWMLEVPFDFLDKWIMIPCPEGVRSLVVACDGVTKAYNRRGYRLGVFQSALPGGNHEHHKGSGTVLDCIWIKEMKMYYVLDVLAWSNQPFLNCDMEFRVFWLTSQFEEMKELQERDSQRNKFPILQLPNISCSSNLNLALENLSSLPTLDGLLFYHIDGHYRKGRTPLVTWLKPFMLPEVLGISVPFQFGEKPDGYIDWRHYILKDCKKKKNKISTDECMEVVDDKS